MKGSVIDFGEGLGIDFHGKRHASIVTREISGNMWNAVFRAA